MRRLLGFQRRVRRRWNSRRTLPAPFVSFWSARVLFLGQRGSDSRAGKFFGMTLARDGVEPPTPAFAELVFSSVSSNFKIALGLANTGNYQEDMRTVGDSLIALPQQQRLNGIHSESVGRSLNPSGQMCFFGAQQTPDVPKVYTRQLAQCRARRGRLSALAITDLLSTKFASADAATPARRCGMRNSWHRLLLCAPGSNQFAAAMWTLSLNHRLM